MEYKDNLNFSASVNKDPYLEILVEPRSRGQRFRYECEGRFAGAILGESSDDTDETKRYPTIKIHNMSPAREAIIVASCVTKDNPFKPHPHSLVGKLCSKGVCTVKLRNGNSEYVFQNLGIQCATKKSIVKKLEERKLIRVDPFGTGFDHINETNSIDMHCIRICFQAFLPDETRQFRKVLAPVVSQLIYDQKTSGDLKICRVSQVSGSISGNTEIFILCDKISRDDIDVIFSDNETGWESKGIFGTCDIHHQCAIVVKSPPYPNQEGLRNNYDFNSFTVKMKLVRRSDKVESNEIDYTYINDMDYTDFEGKRRRKQKVFENIEAGCSSGISNLVRDRVKLKASRKISSLENDSEIFDQLHLGSISENNSYLPDDALAALSRATNNDENVDDFKDLMTFNENDAFDILEENNITVNNNELN